MVWSPFIADGAGAVSVRIAPTTARSPPQARAPMASPVADASRRRREKRRQLDARRSKCRIRLGGHMEQWCLLKERLGFSLHSQLAKFLLDRLGAGRDWGGHPGTAPSRFLQKAFGFLFGQGGTVPPLAAPANGRSVGLAP